MTVWKPEYCSEYTLSTVGREISVDCDCRYMLKLCHFNLGAEDFSNLYRVVRAHAHAMPASQSHTLHAHAHETGLRNINEWSAWQCIVLNSVSAASQLPLL